MRSVAGCREHRGQGGIVLRGSHAETAAAQAQQADVRATTRHFLDAYMRGDRATVLQAVDDRTVLYGSDAAEIFRGKSGVTTMMQEDEQLWRGGASLGEMTDVSVVQEGRLGSIYFNAPFWLGDRPAMPLRIAMLWERRGKTWLLRQSQNAVVTQGQSAAALLGGTH